MTTRMMTALMVTMAAMAFAPNAAHASGMLIPRDGGLQPLEVTYHRVEAVVQDGTSVTKVDQTFRNNTGRVLEATFIFPVPRGAAVDDFALYINGKRTAGEVLERNKARGIYEDIVRRMKDPGLIEWMGNDLFKARVYPIPARGEQRIEIAFSQVLDFDNGVYKYTYPLRTPGAPLQTQNDFTLTARISSKAPIRSVFSPSHEIYVRKKGENAATVGFEKDRAVLDEDFVLYYTVSQKDIGLNLLTYREKDEPGYFLLMASPKSSYESTEILGKSVSFVIDTSGSMAGPKMEHSKAALQYCLRHLDPRDEFNVVRFSSDVERWKDGLQSASKDNVEAAVSFVNEMEAAGGTAIHEALLAALASKPRGPHLIVFITDGRPTVGETDVATIVKEAKGRNEHSARIFAFGVGDDLNAKLLDLVTEQNGGVTSYVHEGKEIETQVSSFYDKVSHPVLTDVEVSIGNLRTFGLLPKKIPDMFRGSQLILVGRYRTDGDALVRLSGHFDQRSVNYDFEGTFPKVSKDNAFIARLWAQRQVGYLLDEIRLHGERSELRDEVVQLATKYGIVTPYTSYLVVEPTAQPVAIPRPRPSTRGGAFLPGDAQFGAGSGGFKGAEKSEAAAPAAAERSADFYDGLASEESLHDAAGKSAVSSAKALRKMKEANKVDKDSRTSVRYVKGRTFEMSGGRWVDRSYREGMKTLKIRYLSQAYFDVLQEFAELAEYMALGDKVTVVKSGVAIVIDANGQETITKSQLEALR